MSTQESILYYASWDFSRFHLNTDWYKIEANQISSKQLLIYFESTYRSFIRALPRFNKVGHIEIKPWWFSDRLWHVFQCKLVNIFIIFIVYWTIVFEFFLRERYITFPLIFSSTYLSNLAKWMWWLFIWGFRLWHKSVILTFLYRIEI